MSAAHATEHGPHRRSAHQALRRRWPFVAHCYAQALRPLRSRIATPMRTSTGISTIAVLESSTMSIRPATPRAGRLRSNNARRWAGFQRSAPAHRVAGTHCALRGAMTTAKRHAPAAPCSSPRCHSYTTRDAGTALGDAGPAPHMGGVLARGASQFSGDYRRSRSRAKPNLAPPSPAPLSARIWNVLHHSKPACPPLGDQKQPRAQDLSF